MSAQASCRVFIPGSIRSDLVDLDDRNPWIGNVGSLGRRVAFPATLSPVNSIAMQVGGGWDGMLTPEVMG